MGLVVPGSGGAVPYPEAVERDIDLLDVQLQNAATWSLLDNAVQTRELTVRLHGAAIGIAPFVVAVVDESVALGIGAIATIFLTAVSIVSFLNVDALRLLQFKLGVEEGRARVRLRGGTATYRTEHSLRPPELRRQRDPMGIVARSALALVALDHLLAGFVLGMVVTVSASNSTRALVATGAVAIGAVAAVITVAVLVRRASEAERRTERELTGESAVQQPAG